MPRNTGAGITVSAFALLLCFALVWHMWLVAGVGFVAMLAAAIVHTFNYDRDFHIPADAVARSEDARTRALAAA
jgi:cytochrome o ubiquinol oxidase subunit 1